MDDKALDLINFVAKMGGEKNLRVEENLGEGFVRLRVAEAERRQAKHDIRCVEDIVVEMLRNSRDAGAKHIFVATTKDQTTRSLVLLDDGCGIPEDMQDKIFDARVTSKLESMHMDKWGVHGRGMALFSVKENVCEAKVTSSQEGLGAAIRVVSEIGVLSEKTDQSTWPQIGLNDKKEQVIVRGPHNIIRTCCEFGLEEKGVCSVYIGSPAEIIASIRRYMRPDVPSTDLLFIDDLDQLAVLDRFYAANTVCELQQVAQSCGLEVSERTLHRIIAQEVKPAQNVVSKLLHSPQSKPSDIDLVKDRRGLKISQDDIDKFSRQMERDFTYLATRYYVSLAKEPKVKVSGNKITVTFDIDKFD